ncbi:Xanthine/uracil permeases [Candidatus Planktophila dulcis]|jgi:uracil-xanthine permease|uniref:Xanthine/uracil permeases n=1 Tax=Candidatus Planktophila dulcis TaxID=1884914 RepID=A0AAC9YTR9_9ACTN|nr:solute carrier family 23 protein [Candidatus Planktophila dulcis]ASY12084.1 Xanthine/uracil permeases [Candidatus Planktophila dulcis]
MSLLSWNLHGNGKSIKDGEVVKPDERLAWPLTIGVGVQHIAAMFGATFLVPIITGFPPSTTLFFSGLGTLIFLALTKNMVPSYLGSSFAFLAPIAAAQASGGMAVALGGVLVTGVILALVGLLINAIGIGWVNWLLPPIVTGSIVMIIGLNLAGAANNNFKAAPVTAIITLAAVAIIGAVSKGFLGRISIFGGIIVGYAFAATQGDINFDGVKAAKWFALPTFTSPSFDTNAILLFLPVVLVLIAENVGHVKAVAAMTGKDLDGQMGNALFADGVATTLAGAGGGSGTTTYAENIGVMAATRIYSTAAYWVAGLGAILLSLCPKFGAVLSATPAGVLGGVGVALYGMIGVLGAKIWIENKVNFGDSTNLLIAATTLIIGIADMTWKSGDYSFGGIVNGTLVAVVGYQLLRALNKASGKAS